jgi:hypothetical protein
MGDISAYIDLVKKRIRMAQNAFSSGSKNYN